MPEEPTAERRLFDLKSAVVYLKSIGADGATLNAIRTLVASGAVPHIKLGKKFYLTKTALDTWLLSHERRRR